MNLLPRFWDVQAGAIRIDGHDLRDVQRPDASATQIGIVLQETTLFNDSVANNIAYGTAHASREAIDRGREAVLCPPVHHSNLPDGYDTILGEQGVGLSGGQRQRIALARAMLRDPAILILDEATSAVDIQDEALIRKAIEEFARGRTTFLITHSLGSLQFADRIVLMNAGRIEAVGTEARAPPLVHPLPPAPRDPLPARERLTSRRVDPGPERRTGRRAKPIPGAERSQSDEPSEANFRRRAKQSSCAERSQNPRLVPLRAAPCGTGREGEAP